MAIDFGTVLTTRAREAGVDLSQVAVLPAVGLVIPIIEGFEQRVFVPRADGTYDLQAVENKLWDDWDSAINAIVYLEKQINSIGPRTKSLIKQSFESRDTAAFPFRVGLNACVPGRDDSSCVTGEPGPYPFVQEAIRNPDQKSNLTYLATTQFEPRLAFAFAEEAAAVLIQRGIELGGLQLGMPGRMPPVIPGSTGVSTGPTHIDGPGFGGATRASASGSSVLPIVIGGAALLGLLLFAKR